MGVLQALSERAVVGGGCFWCTEAIFSRLKGVSKVQPGYMGGHLEHPDYAIVCRGDSGHAEVVEIWFDPKIISYAQLLDVFFATHDPLTLNRQGHDVGTQYRSIIFVQNDDQHAIAHEVVQRTSEALGQPVVTVIEFAKNKPFYPAESEHHDYYANHPAQGYCQLVIHPKLEKMAKTFGSLLSKTDY